MKKIKYQQNENKSMASNEAVLVEKPVSKLCYLQFITIGISTFLNEHFQLVQFLEAIEIRKMYLISKLKSILCTFSMKKILINGGLANFNQTPLFIRVKFQGRNRPKNNNNYEKLCQERLRLNHTFYFLIYEFYWLK